MSSINADANAKFVTKESINIIINGKSVVLSHGDCIKFNRYLNLYNGEDIRSYVCTAKIIGFGYNGSPSNPNVIINRILYLPWRDEEGRWGSETREIGLASSNLTLHNIKEWQTIQKIPCPVPVQAAGKYKNKYKNRKSTKQTRRRKKKRSRVNKF
jgi:hypothetical protein